MDGAMLIHDLPPLPDGALGWALRYPDGHTMYLTARVLDVNDPFDLIRPYWAEGPQ
jgi:hypothetical protein